VLREGMERTDLLLVLVEVEVEVQEELHLLMVKVVVLVVVVASQELEELEDLGVEALSDSL
jgi:hypothetical protein